MNSNYISKIDLSKKAIDTWNSFDPEEKDFWSEYFELKKIQRSDVDRFKPFKHDYNYFLDDENVSRVVFCAVVETVRYNVSNKMNRAFIGNSGGLDSAVTCALLSKAVKLSKDLGKEFSVISYGMPLYSNPDHDLRAIETAKLFDIRHVKVDGLNEVLDSFKKVVLPLAEDFEFNEEEKRRGIGNVKARIRMIVNFFGTTQVGGYVVSTDNLSELYMAFWTLMGDVGAFGPIQNILKGLELPAVAYALGVPEKTLGAKPTDGLEVHKSLDEQEGGDADAFKGVQYPHLDAIICHAVKSGLGLNKQEFAKVDADLIASDHATQEIVDNLVKQMVSPASVWKREKGSIGSAIPREDLGLLFLKDIADKL